MPVNPRSKATPEWLAPILATIHRPDYERDTPVFNASFVLALIVGGVMVMSVLIALDMA